jgi:hemerythrin superfamily protein
MAETADKTEATATRESGKVDALVLLEADHRAVEKLFDAFEKAGSDLEAKAALAQRACEELSVHAMIEEEFLYPAAADALPGSNLIDVDEAYVEHYLVKALIKRFETLKAGD